MKRGNLFKWTNYLSGWQCRYVVVERGTLSYYRNELDMEFGCRGVIHLGKLFQNLSFAILDLLIVLWDEDNKSIQAKIEIIEHDFDPPRFDLLLSDGTSWYFR